MIQELHVAQHHDAGEQQSRGVGLVLSRDGGGGSVHLWGRAVSRGGGNLSRPYWLLDTHELRLHGLVENVDVLGVDNYSNKFKLLPPPWRNAILKLKKGFS